MNIQVNILLSHNDGWWTATCDTVDCCGAGASREDAINNLMLTVCSHFLSGALRALKAPSERVDLQGTERMSLSNAVFPNPPERWPFEHIERISFPLGSNAPVSQHPGA